MDPILDQLIRLRGVGGCLVLSSEGLTVASRLREGVDEDDLAAQVSELISQSQAACDRMQIGAATLIHAQSESGALALMAAGDAAFLAVVIDPAANLALLQLEIQPFVDALSKQLAW